MMCFYYCLCIKNTFVTTLLLEYNNNSNTVKTDMCQFNILYPASKVRCCGHPELVFATVSYW